MSNKDNNSQPLTFISNDEKLKMEPIQAIDKYSLINETKIFDQSQYQCENQRILLTKLIYGFHQGIMFSQQEQDVLFFRVTKLFQQHDPGLRRIIYKTLKFLKVENLMKDLKSSNQIIKIEALRLISTIEEEEHIIQIERFVQQAILDKNMFISNTALIAGIKLANKFPHVVQRWKAEIQFVLNQSQQINFHALLLLYEINKNNRITVVDFLKYPLQPQMQIVNLQILKFIKEVSSKLDSKEIFHQEIMLFLDYSINNCQNLIFLEAYSIILQNRDLQNIYTHQIHLQFIKIFNPYYNMMEIYMGLELLGQAIKTFGKTHIVVLKVYLEGGTFYPHASLSGISFFMCMQLKQEQLGTYLKYLFNQHQIEDFQYSFLEGMCELIDLHPEYLQSVMDFLQLIVLKDYGYKLRVSAIKIICYALISLKYMRHIILKILFGLSLPSEIQLQFQTNLVICSICFEIGTKLLQQIDSPNTLCMFEYLKHKFENGSDAFYNDQCEEYTFIRKQLLEIIGKQNDNILIARYSNLDNIYENSGQKLIDNQKADSKGLLTKKQIKSQREFNNIQNI